MTKVVKKLKARNWVAKNMTGRHSVHKNKKREEKLGKTKHKGKDND